MIEIVGRLPVAVDLKRELALTEAQRKLKRLRDEVVARILAGRSDKFLMLVGPCSADSADAVLEYTAALAKVAAKVQDKILIVPRVFTAKPRTTTAGYMGLVHDADGIKAARRLHIDVLRTSGLVTADELLYPSLYPYFDDVVSYFVIGARSVENQEHRLVASGINVAVGLKNPQSGNVLTHINAITAAQNHHSFLYNGHRVRTGGNYLAHAILRGTTDAEGKNAPNYSGDSLLALRDAFSKAGISRPSVIVDANHANSDKDHTKQPKIALDIVRMRKNSPAIAKLVKGVMVESYILEGNTENEGPGFGRSVTDSCLSLEDTEKLILEMGEIL
jgi:3-deoxy-7-phosphoheptulonate synthase